MAMLIRPFTWKIDYIVKYIYIFSVAFILRFELYLAISCGLLDVLQMPLEAPIFTFTQNTSRQFV